LERWVLRERITTRPITVRIRSVNALNAALVSNDLKYGLELRTPLEIPKLLNNNGALALLYQADRIP
jgi:hypothetical protein